MSILYHRVATVFPVPVTFHRPSGGYTSGVTHMTVCGMPISPPDKKTYRVGDIIWEVMYGNSMVNYDCDKCGTHETPP